MNTMRVRLLLIVFLSGILFFGCKKDEFPDDDPNLEPITLSGNQTSPINIENIFNNPERVDYIVSGTWNITAPVTVEPGVRFSMLSGSRIRISGSGSFQALGTQNAPIIFAGEESAQGYWDYIAFESNSPNNRLEFCEIRDGGGSSLSSYVGMVVLRNNAQAAFLNCKISNSQRNGLHVADNDSRISAFSSNEFSACLLYPISLRSSHIAALDFETTFTVNNGFNQIEVSGNTINAPANIPKVNGPYVFKGTTSMEAPIEIEPGTLIEMGPSARINITASGSLRAIGTVNDRITITGEQPAKGYWDYIYFNASSSPNNQLKFVDISYGGGSTLSCCGANIAATNSSFSLENCSINDSQRWGMRLRSNTQFEDLGGNTFNGNTLGDIDD